MHNDNTPYQVLFQLVFSAGRLIVLCSRVHRFGTSVA
jgi:hypothetical protein